MHAERRATSAHRDYEHNEGAISNGDGESSSKRSRYVHIKYHYTREQVNMKTIQVLHIASKDQLADLLTKGLYVVLTRKFRKLILDMQSLVIINN